MSLDIVQLLFEGGCLVVFVENGELNSDMMIIHAGKLH